MAYSKETIVLVHGTFSSPREGVRQWWQGGPGSDFASKLDGALEKRGIEVRCWSHCTEPSFHWSGDNDWVERAAASAALSRHISDLARAGWRCHLIGHSHGGNVIVESVNALHGKPVGQAIASVVTLGTPFLGVHVNVERYRRQLRLGAAGMFSIGTLILSLPLALMLADVKNAGPGLLAFFGAVVAILIGVIASILIIILNDRARRKRAQRATPIPALALNSRYDEAWQLLHHVRETPNPLAVQDGLLRYLWRRMRDHVVRKQAVQKATRPFAVQDIALPSWTKWLYRFLYTLILGAGCIPIWTYGWGLPGLLVGFAFAFMAFALFGVLIMAISIRSWGYAAAFFEPLATGAMWIASLGIVPSEVVTYLVRKRSWSLLQRWVMGLDGFRFALPSVRTTPADAGAAKFEFEALDGEAEKRALASRSQWLTQKVDGATELFAQVVLSASDAVRLLRDIERDATLVHAAYYMDDASIDQIANWIAANAVSSVHRKSAEAGQ